MRIEVAETIWEIPTTEKPGLPVPARLYGTPTVLESMDRAVNEPITNVASLAGITSDAFCGVRRLTRGGGLAGRYR